MDYNSGMDGEGAQPQSYPQLIHNVVLKQRNFKNLVDKMVFGALDPGPKFSELPAQNRLNKILLQL
jgi:hypothetical protein